jgi:hypothetical protein
MADAESKKAPRRSSAPAAPQKPLKTESSDGLETLEVIEATTTQVRSLGPPPRPSMRPQKAEASETDAAPEAGDAAVRTDETAPKATEASRPTSGPPPLPTPAPPVARSKSIEPPKLTEAPSAAVPPAGPATPGVPPAPAAPAPAATAPAAAAAPSPEATTEPKPPSPAAAILPRPPSPSRELGTPEATTAPKGGPEARLQVESEIERLKAEVGTLKNTTSRPSAIRSNWPYVAIALLSGTLGYLLGDAIESRQRAEIRKVAMERFFALSGRPADEQKEALQFVQRHLTKDDPELARWAKSQVSVVEERLLAMQEREAALKVRVSDLKATLDQKTAEAEALSVDKTRLTERVQALESVEKKLDRLKQSNALLIQARVGIERLSRQLSDIAESPDAQTVSPNP